MTQFAEGNRVEHRGLHTSDETPAMGTVQETVEADGFDNVLVRWDSNVVGVANRPFYAFASNLTIIPDDLCDFVPDEALINPKQIVGSTKTPLDYLEPAAEEAISHVMKHGADKYGRENYKQSEILLSIYVGAVKRHINALRNGEAIDPDSGQSHWAHIGACAMVCLAAMDAGTYTEDVPYVSDLPVETGVWKNTGFEPLDEED